MKFGTDARKVKTKFLNVFARFGLPDVVVTDGGPPFSSKELIDFFEKHGVKVMKSPPYNPSSNGQAERMVRVVKEGFRWRESLLRSSKSAEAGGHPKAPRFVLGEEREGPAKKAC
ncbi:uncharacterized protein K02A2.6-like [Armigeres subalbatus]